MLLLDRLERLPRAIVVALSLAAVLLIALAKHWAGPGFTFLLFYLVPVFAAAWLVGRRAGVLISAVGAVAYFVSEGMGRGFETRPLVPVFNFAARLGAFLFVTYFVSALRRSLEQERAAARTDALTGALNRRSFFEAAEMEIKRARRHRQPFTVAYLDIDDFKELNDHFGHTAGDAALRALTDTLRGGVREIDSVARLGGDEFVLLMPETDDAAARAVVMRVRECLTRVAADNRWPISFSVGVVTWTTPPRTVDAMIKQADDTMYEVKNTGKNRIAHLKISGEPHPEAEPAEAEEVLSR
ncbi:MAG TPA: diguanylate cyclase [Pyrinomonadaceae bacterium]|nr:diguanylate cyclase [Pyrinomonadaceae bacterium]